MFRILIVDDDPLSCEMIQEALLITERPFDIHWANQQDEAIRLAQHHASRGVAFEVFLIDMKLGPGPDGIEMMHYMKRINPDADFIIFTGWGNPEDGLRAFKAGAFRYLPKPIQIEELIFVLDELNQWRNLQKERNWLQIFTEIAEEAQICTNINQLAKVVTRQAVHLGFEVAAYYECLNGGIARLLEIQYEEGIPSIPSSLPANIEQDSVVIKALSSHTIAQASEEQFQGEISSDLLAKASLIKTVTVLPFFLTEENLGFLLLFNLTYKRLMSQEENDQLILLSRLISGNIERIHLYVKEREDTRRLDILQRASVELISIANQDEQKFWITLLTLTTAHYGLGFNRAWIFLAEAANQRLRGVAAIGYLAGDDRWGRYPEPLDSLSFDRFIVDLHQQKVLSTPLGDLTRGMTIDLQESGGAFLKVLGTGKRMLVTQSKEQAQPRSPTMLPNEQLPGIFRDIFDPSDCAILPLRSDLAVVGLMIVDNRQSKLPIQESTLDRLETLTNISGLVWQNLVQRRRLEAIQQASYSIMGSASQQPLGRTLKRICEAACTLIGADWSIIYPLLPGDNVAQFDKNNVAYAGSLEPKSVNLRPSPLGFSSQVLKGGLVMVNDIQADENRYGRIRLSEHSFITQEKIRAMIGTPINNLENDQVVGIFYINFIATQCFTDHDKLQVQSLTNLASVAIQNFRRVEQVGRSLDQAQRGRKSSQRELEFIHRFLENTLAGASEADVIRNLLTNLNLVFDQPDIRAVIYLKKWETDPRNNEPREIAEGFTLSATGSVIQVEPDIFEQAFIETIFSNKGSEFRQHGRKIFQPIISQKTDCVGLISIDVSHLSPQLEFIPIIQRFSASAAVALDHVRRRQYLEWVLDAAGAGTAPMDLNHFFQFVEETTRKISPDLSVLSLWYQDPESGRIKYGYACGLWDKKNQLDGNIEPGNVVREVMNLDTPVFESHAASSLLLSGPFIQHEKIISAAAFPLHVEREHIGAMFLNYRRPHQFSPDEIAIFQILSNVVAVRIRDAVQLEAVHKEQKRLLTASDISLAIGHLHHPEQLFETIVHCLTQSFPRTNIVIATYDQNDEALIFSPSTLLHYPIDHPDLKNQKGTSIHYPSIAARLARSSLETNQSEFLYVPDVLADPDYFPAHRKTRSELCASLVSSGHLLGILVLERPIRHGFDKDDELLIRAVVPQISLALERAQTIV